MKRTIISLLSVIFSTIGVSQEITCSPEERKAVEEKIKTIRGLAKTDFGTTLVVVGKWSQKQQY